MRYITAIGLIAASLALVSCGNKNTTVTGVSTIKLEGGSANLSSPGGDGGSIIIDSFSNVRIRTDGTVTTFFIVQTVSPVFGDNPYPDPKKGFTFTGTKTVKLNTDSLAVNDLYVFLNGDMRLHLKTSAGDEVITGLTVPAGATLILPVNDTALNAVALIFANSVVIDGTLKTEVSGTNLYLEAGNAGSTITGNQSLLQVSSTGSVTTAGTTGNGGNLFLFSWGGLINQGVTQGGNQRGLDASGLAGSGGNAGFIELESFGFLYNTGTVTARGGSNAAGAGGNGNRIAMTAFNASLNTIGTLDNSGGDGSGNGGAGGAVYLLGGINDVTKPSNPFGFTNISTATGRVLIGGTLTSNGGQSQSGIGGSAGGNNNGPTAPGIFLESGESGGLLVNARITARGGATTTGSSGGSGGTLTLNQHFGPSFTSDNSAPIEGIKLGSVIDLSGGASVSAGNGGAAGNIIISNNFSPDAYPSQTSSTGTAGLELIELDGYFSINLSGGDAGTGGDAGAFHIYTASPMSASVVFPAPAISNAVPITARGGDGNQQTGRGGHGGFLDWQVGGKTPKDYNNAFQEQISVLTSTGAIDISGGAGDSGGTAGDLSFYGYTLKSNGIYLRANGGKGTTTGGNGSASLTMNATLSLANSSVIASAGGSGVTGGSGGHVGLFAGKQVTNSAGISANGGNGTANGGNGNKIELASGQRATSTTGALNVAKGSGGTTATIGRIFIDFVERFVPSSGILF